MRDARRRVGALEHELRVGAADDGFCQCEGKVRMRVLWDEPEPEPERCPRCGRLVRNIEVTWDYDGIQGEV